jgi:hypothetical protein
VNRDRFLAVTVEARDIAGGCRAVANNCPLARALGRTYGGEWSVSDSGTFGSGTSLGWVALAMPRDVAAILNGYDIGLPMYPFTALFDRRAA